MRLTTGVSGSLEVSTEALEELGNWDDGRTWLAASIPTTLLCNLVSAWDSWVRT